MIGALVGIRYEVDQELDSNPLFASYRATDRQSGRDVRLRVLATQFCTERAFVQAVTEHARKLQNVVHPAVERVTDVVDDGEHTAVVSEYFQASTLDDRVKRLASFSVQLALTTGVGVCEGVAALHDSGIVHGDISGKNVLVTPSGAVKVAMPGYWSTFGLSARAGLAMLRGMAPYLAPEVTAGSMPNVASDVYALGVLLFQMLAGRLPYSGDTTVAVATKHATAPYPSLRATNPSVPEALDEVVKKCLSKSPPDRYLSVPELLADLRAIQDALRFGRPLAWPLRKKPVEAPRVAPVVEEPVVSPKPKPSRRADREEQEGLPKWVVGFVYVSMVAFLAALGGWAWFNTHQPKLIEMPNITFKSQMEAAAELDRLGLKMSVQRRQESEKYPAGVVLDQDPAAGPKKVKEGGIVQVVVSSGGRFVEVPDLRGRSIEDATALLHDLKLEVADNVEKVRDKELAEGLVAAQVPEPLKKVERGSKIRLKVSAGDTPVPGDSQPAGRYTYRLNVKMPAGPNSVTVRIEMTDDRETKTIHEQEHVPGETFEVEADGFGKQAIFRIFFDNDLIDQITKRAEEGSNRQ